LKHNTINLVYSQQLYGSKMCKYIFVIMTKYLISSGISHNNPRVQLTIKNNENLK